MELLILIIGVLICIYGIVNQTVSLGIVFIISLVESLYILFIVTLNKTRITNVGIVIFIISFLVLIYTSCDLFFGIDVKSILKL